MLQQFLTVFLSKSTVNKTIEEYEKYQHENIGVLRPPKFIFILGAVSSVFWAVLMTAVLLSSKDGITLTFCGIIFGILFALGLFLMLYAGNFMVIYRDNQIIYRNFFHLTHKFNCQDIELAYYTDSGGLKIIFKDRKKLTFSKEERFFYNEIVKNEHLKCRFNGEEISIIKVYLHPFLMCPLWIVNGALIFCSILYPTLFLFAILMLIFCIGCQLSNTEYNKESKILTRRKYGFSRKYDMHFCSAKPLYEENFLMAIEIYERNKKVAKIPVSREYKNRARLISALCGIIV